MLTRLMDISVTAKMDIAEYTVKLVSNPPIRNGKSSTFFVTNFPTIEYPTDYSCFERGYPCAALPKRINGKGNLRLFHHI